MTRSKDIGTRAETAVVRWLQEHGWPHAERSALHGTRDVGDVTGCPGICWEIKAGKAAQTAGLAQVDAWCQETLTEMSNRGADEAVLVIQRRGYGPARVAAWRALWWQPEWNIWIEAPLCSVSAQLRSAGYGDPP